MNYLYGDSSPSPLTVNYIELLRDGLELSVELLLASQETQALTKRGLAARGAADVEVKHIEGLASLVESALERAPANGAPSMAQCAQAIVRASVEQVKAGIDGVRASLAVETARLDALTAAERERALRALERFLVKNDLPDTSYSLLLEQQGGVRYSGRIATSAGSGLDAILDLAIPAGTVFSQVAVVERFAQGLEVQVPDSGGFFRKEGKMKAMRIDKMHVVELSIGDGNAFELRANADGTGGGFGATVDADGANMRITYVNEKGEAAAATEPQSGDIPKLTMLFEKLATAGAEVRLFRKSLLDAKLDEEDFSEHDEPTALVERLVEEMAPVVQEIARRSTPTEELIIKRVTGDKRREEIFIAKSELLMLLAPLPTALRVLFDPLGLDEQRPSTRPAPVVERSAPSRRPPPMPEVSTEGPDIELEVD